MANFQFQKENILKLAENEGIPLTKKERSLENTYKHIF